MPYDLLSRRVPQHHLVISVRRGLEVKSSVDVDGLLLSFDTQAGVIGRPLGGNRAAAILVPVFAGIAPV